MQRTQITMNKPVYLCLAMLLIFKTVIYAFGCDYVKPKYGQKAKLCCIDTDGFIAHMVKQDLILQFMN